MIPLADAQARVLAGIEALPARRVRAVDALGLVLAADVIATEPIPPFANTAMDGYAVRSDDTTTASESGPVELRVVGELPAGRAPTTAVGVGEAIRIMTGAPVPPGADAIVMVEHTERAGDAGSGAETVRVMMAARAGDHVRFAGGDITAGSVVFGAGTVVRAAHLGVLASLDVDEIDVVPRARVGVLSTGDELVERGPLAPGQIRDSNRPMLRALVEEAGAVVVDLGTARDDEATITKAIETAADTCDALVTSGAVSVGDYDFVKSAIEAVARDRPGSDYMWAQVAIKPAKPFAAGTLHLGERPVPVFGLPGNPVAAMVVFHALVREALSTLMGARVEPLACLQLICDAPLHKAEGRTEFVRGIAYRSDDGWHVRPTGAQGSGILRSMSEANCLIVLDHHRGDIAAGATVEAWPFDGLT